MRRSKRTAELTEADIQHFLIVYGDDLDIVLVGADSLETVKRTHSSYFGDTAETFESLLPAGVLAR